MQWLRHYQRVKDLKLSIPDPSVSLTGLDLFVKKVPLEGRHFSPSEEAMLGVHRALLPEFEQMGKKEDETSE